MKSSESVVNLSSALVKVQSEIENLYPSSKGYSYDYVPLNKIIDMLKKVLPSHGLGYVQLPVGGQSGTTVGLTTRIFHESGEWLEETAEFPLTDMKGVNATQKAGAAVTYFRRYALLSAFGITGDKDVDANDQAWAKDTSDLKSKLESYIKSGIFSEKGKEQALKYIAENDVAGMQRTIAWAEKQPH